MIIVSYKARVVVVRNVIGARIGTKREVGRGARGPATNRNGSAISAEDIQFTFPLPFPFALKLEI